MNKTLTTDIELFAAALSQARVTIVQRTADDIPVIEDAGVVERYDEYSVKINGVYYVRSESEFRVQ